MNKPQRNLAMPARKSARNNALRFPVVFEWIAQVELASADMLDISFDASAAKTSNNLDPFFFDQ